MKALEQARPNLPQKPAKSTKQGDKGGGKPETFNAVDDDGEVSAATSSKPAKVSSKAGKPNSATAAAAGKKVCFLMLTCHALITLLRVPA